MTSHSPAAAETHISTVLFSDDRACKLLKPIRTSFLDHRTVESRRDAVEDELTLNRRMAPDVYLGTGVIHENDAVTDHILVMRRMPSDRRLSALLQQHSHGDCLRAVARRIAAFHAAQRPLVDARPIAGRDAVRTNWSDNLRDVALLDPGEVDRDLLEEVRRLAMNYLDYSESLFDDRLAQGAVRDGHGDLTTEDIFCLDDGPRIIDCLAFDARLRIGDVLLDVAFLAMDVERLAGHDAAEELWRYYAEFSGERHPASLAYDEVMTRSRGLLERGSSVILDASFAREVQRDQARRLSADSGAALTELCCTVDSATATHRINNRLDSRSDPSDAHPAILDELRHRFEPWSSATRIATARPVAAVLAAAMASVDSQATEAPFVQPG